MLGIETVAMTPRGDVDLVAVERVMAGVPCPITPAEMSYLLTMLARSLHDEPALHLGGNSLRDPRISAAAEGIGTEPKKLCDRLATHRKRWGLELPRAWAAGGERAAQGVMRGNSQTCCLGHPRTRLPGGSMYCRECHKTRRAERKAAGVGA